MEVENELIDQGDHQSQNNAEQIPQQEQGQLQQTQEQASQLTGQEQQDSQGVEGNNNNNPADQFFVEVVTNTTQRTTTPAKNTNDIAAEEITLEAVVANDGQVSSSKQQNDDVEQPIEDQLVDLGEQLNTILKQFGENVKSTYSLDNIKLLIVEEDILTDHRSVFYELITYNQAFFQKNVGKVATIGHAEIKAELAASTHNIILTLYAKDITVEGSQEAVMASFKIFDQLQYRDQKVLHDLAFAAKKALIREAESVSYVDTGIWKMLTEDYKKAAQTMLPPAAGIPMKQQITSVQKQQLEVIPAATKKIQRAPQKKQQKEASNKGENNSSTKKQQQDNKNQMEEEVKNDEEPKLRQQAQGSVSVLKSTKTPSVNKAVTEEQRKSLNSLYQSNKTTAKNDQMEEEDQGEEEQEDIDGGVKSAKRAEITASIKKNSIMRINEIRKKADQTPEKDQKQIEAEEYTRKLQKLQKFVLKKELLYFISQNDFQKKAEVRNMVLPRDPVDKDRMKSYSQTTIKHLEAQYK